MATIRTTYKYKCDLDKGTLETSLRNSLMQADALADAFAVTVQRNGADVDISGMTVYGYLYANATQSTVPIKGTVSGSTATVILSEDCYAVPGYASLMIQLHDGDVRHTVLKVDFVVTRTGGTLVMDGDNVLPTLAELLGQISAMEQATANANTTIATVKADTAAAIKTTNEATAAANTATVELAKTAAPAITPTATGEIVDVSDSAHRPLAGLRLYGKTTQDGTPTPDAPVPLVNVGAGGSIKAVACGANLLRRTDLLDGYQVSKPGDAAAIMDGYGWRKEVAVGSVGVTIGQTIKLPCLRPGATYTLSFVAWHSGTGACYVDCYPNTLPEKRITLSGTATRYTWTFSSDHADMAGARIRVFGENTGSDTWIVRVTDIQLEAGSAASAFASYADGGSLTASTPNGLPGIKVSSGGNYTDESGQQWVCDEIDFGRGVHVQRVQEIVMDSNIIFGAYGNSGVYTNIANGKNVGKLLCNIAEYKTAGALYKEETYGVSENFAYGQIAFRLEGLTTVEAYKEFFAKREANGNSVIVIHALAAPIETPLSAEELAAYGKLTSQYPHTTVYNDAGAGMQVDYIADTQLYIDNKFSALEAALLSTGANV